MPRRSPARYLAPLALVGFLIALIAVVNASTPDDEPVAKPAATQAGAGAAKRTGPAARKRRTRRAYVVKPGDTPSGIAEKTGVPLSRIVQLNPDLDPQALAPGTRLKLR